MNTMFKADTNPKKMNLGVGAYRDETGKPWVLPSVRKAEQMILDEDMPKCYLPIDGYAPFNEAAARLVFGNQMFEEYQDRIVTCQELSGTGSLRVALEFLRNFVPEAELYIPKPTWANHVKIYQRSHGKEPHTYRYLAGRSVDVDGLIEDISAAPAHSIILMHPCAHNPTGYDIEDRDWDRVLDTLADKEHIPMFDSAYQGYASGDLDRDIKVVRDAVKRGLEVIVTQSFAKNMGLYGERAGAIHIVCRDPAVVAGVRSQVKMTVRPMHSSSPCHGAYIAATVLNTPELRTMWIDELKFMSKRIISMRSALTEALEKKGVVFPGGNDHIMRQVGMFSFTGLTLDQVLYMREHYAVYMLENGRISMAGLNPGNVDLFAEAVREAIANHPF